MEPKKMNNANNKKTNKTLTYISTFNGIGAFSNALRQMNIEANPLYICEIDEAANKTFYSNNVWDAKKHIDDINDLLKNVKKDLLIDILVQTPPCQSFSMAGKREGLNVNNGNLFLTAINLQKKIDSSIVIYENVKGILSHDRTISKHKSSINTEYKNSIGFTFHTIEQELLKDNRYNYYWNVINAKEQGFPQNRERVFIIGIKKSLDVSNSFQYPQKKELQFTVQDILEKIVSEDYFYKNNANHPLIPLNKKQVANQIHTLAEYSETMTYQATRKVYAPYISPCIACNNNSKFMIDGQVRFLTPLENKRIHGFDESFNFIGTKTQINKQLGNTVSPGVYKRLLEPISNYLEVGTPKQIEKRTRKPKATKIINDNINVIKKIVNNPDIKYLNLTQARIDEYQQHLKNGGTITVTIEKYKTLKDKMNKKLESKKIITVDSMKQLGLRDAKNGIYRCKIIGSTDTLDKKIGKLNVLIIRPGGKSKYAAQMHEALENINAPKTKYPTVVDCFFGGGAMTLKNIENLNFDRYIINDLEPMIYKTMLAVKKHYKKVIEIYTKVNNHYLNLMSDELKNYKKDVECTTRMDPKLQKIRKSDRSYMDFYQQIGNELNNHKVMDIYTVAAYFIFFNQRSMLGILEHNPDGTIKVKSGNSSTSLNDKSKMIKHWAYILNFYGVEVQNRDVLELLEDKTISSQSLIFSDGPYISPKESKKVVDYGMDNSDRFQFQLQSSLNRFENLIYCNESCENLFKLGLHNGFDGYLQFSRKNLMGQKKGSKSTAEEFMGYRGRRAIPTVVNNSHYKMIEEKMAA